MSASSKKYIQWLQRVRECFRSGHTDEEGSVRADGGPTDNESDAQPTPSDESAETTDEVGSGSRIQRRTILKMIGGGAVAVGATGGGFMLASQPDDPESRLRVPAENTRVDTGLTGLGFDETVVDVTAERALVRYRIPSGLSVEDSITTVLMTAGLYSSDPTNIVLQPYRNDTKIAEATVEMGIVQSYLAGSTSYNELQDAIEWTDTPGDYELESSESEAESLIHGELEFLSDANNHTQLTTVIEDKPAAVNTGVNVFPAHTNEPTPTGEKVRCLSANRIGKNVQDNREEINKIVDEIVPDDKWDLTKIVASEAGKELADKISNKYLTRVFNLVSKVSNGATVLSFFLTTETSLGEAPGKFIIINDATKEVYSTWLTGGTGDFALPRQGPCKGQHRGPRPEDGLPIYERCHTEDAPNIAGLAEPGEVSYEKPEGSQERGILWVDCDQDSRTESRCPTPEHSDGDVVYTTNDEGRAIKIIYKDIDCQDERKICRPTIKIRNREGEAITRDIDGDDKKERLVFGSEPCPKELDCPDSKDKLGKHVLERIYEKNDGEWEERWKVFVYHKVKCPTKYSCPDEENPHGTERIIEKDDHIEVIKYHRSYCCGEQASLDQDPLRGDDALVKSANTALVQSPDRVKKAVADKRRPIQMKCDYREKPRLFSIFNQKRGLVPQI